MSTRTCLPASRIRPRIGLDLPQADAVVFGALPQFVPLDDLQIPQPHHDKRQRDRDDDEQYLEFILELTRLIPVEPVVYLLHAEKPRND